MFDPSHCKDVPHAASATKPQRDLNASENCLAPTSRQHGQPEESVESLHPRRKRRARRLALAYLLFTIGVPSTGSSQGMRAPAALSSPEEGAEPDPARGADRAVSAPSTTADRSQDEGRRVASVGLVTGETADGAFARILADLYAELSADRIDIKPIRSGGPLRTLAALVDRPDADVGLVQADALESLRESGPPRIRGRGFRAIARLYDEHVHIIAREGIADVRRLDGRRVSIDRPESGSHMTARLLFERLGIEPVVTTDDPPRALERLRAGEIDAVLVLAPRPSVDMLQVQQDGFHLVPLPWVPEVGRVYRPAELTGSDYPTLIRGGERIPTLAVGVVLVTREPPAGSAGSSRVRRFVQSFEARLGRLRQAGHHFPWGEVNLSADVEGRSRLAVRGAPPAAEDHVPGDLGRGALKTDE